MSKHSRLCNIFHNMKKRCYNVNDKDYMNYGARGITLCAEWANTSKSSIGNCSKGYIAFKQWALSNGYEDGLTIDRIDVDKSYSPSNCRWVDMNTQENNRRNNFYITYQGKSKSLAYWCRELNINYERTFRRIHDLLWSVERAFESV